MDHSLAVTQIVLICSLGMNGFWLGNRLVVWCRRQRGRLLMLSLSMLGFGAMLFYLFVFASLPTQYHMSAFAVSIINDAILVTCFNEWIRVLPQPWGRGQLLDE